MHHKIIYLSVLAVLSTLFVGCQAQPKFTTYQQNINVGNKLTTSTGAAFPFYLHFYFTANDTTLYGAAVTNFTGWVGIGLSSSGNMIPNNDAIVTYYDPNSQTMGIKDLSLTARSVGNQGSCYSSPGVCADEDRQNCVNNVELVSFHLNGSFHVWEFTRPLAASDSCDLTVPTGASSGYVIASAGQMDTSGSVALPYNMQQHNYRTSSGFSNTFLTGPIPLANGTATTTTSTSGTATTGTSTTSTSTSGTSSSTSSTSGTTGTTGTTGSTATTGSSTTGSSSGGIQCTKDISQQCLAECSPKFVDYCRCNITTNTLVYICKDSFSAAMSFGTPSYWIALILGLLALLQ